LSEQFAKLGDSIYFLSPPPSSAASDLHDATHRVAPPRTPSVFVNLFESSTLTIRDGLTLRQRAGFPTSTNSTTVITVAGGAVDIKLRVPFWASNTSGNSIRLNGMPLRSEIKPSSYVAISLKDEDRLDVYYPLSLRFEQLDDARPAFAGLGTIHYGPLLLAGLTTEQALLLWNASAAAVQSVVRRTSADDADLSFTATPTGDCRLPRSFRMIPFNDVRNHAFALSRYTTYFYTRPKVYAKTTPTGTPQLQLAAAVDFALAGGASVAPIGSADAPSLPAEHSHQHLTHQALADPLYSRWAGRVGDFDDVTGSHYRLPDSDTVEHASTKPLQLSSGLPHTNSSAMMAAPFTGSGRLKSVSFALRFTVGYPAQPPKNVTCASGTKLAGGSIHVANLSSVEAAISWCQDMPKCAGFTAQASTCGASQQSRQMRQYQFKDSWGVQHRSAAESWAAWSVPPPPPPSAQGSVIRLGFHRDLNCPTATATATNGNVSWLWASQAYLPCTTTPSDCSQTVKVSVNALDVVAPPAAPAALALHFVNGDHDLSIRLPLHVNLTWH
jgi:hypothetical protein